MEGFRDLVFSQRKIVTSNSAAGQFNLSIDEANNQLYKFYQQNKAKLNAYFITVLKATNDCGISVERVSQSSLLEKLNEQAYKDRVIKIKIWAVYEKNIDEPTLKDIFDVDSSNAHSIQDLSQKMRSLDINNTEPEQETPNHGIKPAKNPLKKSDSLPQSEKKVEKQNSMPTEKTTSATKPSIFDKSNQKEKEKEKEKEKDKIIPEEKHEKHDKQEKAIPRTNTLEKMFENKPEKAEKTLQKSNTIEKVEAKTPEPEVRKKKKAILSDMNADKETAQPQKKTKITQKEEESNENREPNTQHNKDKIQDEEESYYGEKIAERQGSGIKDEAQEEKPAAKRVIKKIETPKPSANKPPSRQSSDIIEAPESPEVIKVKKVRKVPKERTYMDEKGYLTVETVLEDEEYWEEVKKTKSIGGTQSSQAQASKKPVDKNQSTLMSFFKKA